MLGLRRSGLLRTMETKCHMHTLAGDSGFAPHYIPIPCQLQAVKIGENTHE